MRKPSADIKRRMVPRWRTLAMTPPAELSSSGRNRAAPTLIIDHDEVVAEWEAGPTLWSAADLLSVSLLVGRTKKSDAAAAFLSEHRDELSDGVRRNLAIYAGDEFVDGPNLEPFRHHSSKISKLKKLRDLYPRNPIVYVELARHYATLGQLGSARDMFSVAIKLAPHNRYVVRSSVRFHIHDDNIELAHWILSNANGLDPWILASKIAVAHIANKPIDGVKSARSIIDRVPASQHTELSAALGTLELVSGSFKSSRKHFRASAERPNDNTVAQLRWANEVAGVPFDRDMLDTELSFEARTGQAVTDQKWGEVIDNATKWMIDEPFSLRAADIGSFYASEIARDFTALEWFSDAALLNSPNNSSFLNNRAYARLNLDLVDEAKKDIESAKAHSPNEVTKIYLTATEGCYYYRMGNPAIGFQKYLEAIEAASDGGHEDALKAAFIHLDFEENRAGRVLSDELAHRMALALNIEKASPVIRAMHHAHSSRGGGPAAGAKVPLATTESVLAGARYPQLHPSVLELPTWHRRWRPSDSQ